MTLVETPRLSRAYLASAGAGANALAVRRHGEGIVHLGIGAFHRAHQAVFTQQAMLASGGDWTIVGASLRSPSVHAAMQPQDCFYTVVERDADGDTETIIGSVSRVIIAPDDPEALIATIAQPNIHIVTLTVTEKGYCCDPATGKLNHHHPDIKHDLANPDRPRSAIGYLYAACARRRLQDADQLTIISCDNLPDNGRRLKAMVLDFAASLDGDLAQWIASHVSFPCTMIDRIVPALSGEEIANFAARSSYYDEAIVSTEPFSQWVIEDNFSGPRPQWEKAGAILTHDVARFEKAKLRMLNGAHSAIAYLGHCAGAQTVDKALRHSAIRAMVGRLMHDEAIPTLEEPGGIGLTEYADLLMHRFDNPALKHRTYQIAMDGSQKLPQRLLATISDNIADGRPYPACALAVAAWICFTCGEDAHGSRYAVQDPLAARLAQIHAQASGDAGGLVDRFLAIAEVFPEPLAHDRAFRAQLTGWLERLHSEGPLKAAAHI